MIRNAVRVRRPRRFAAAVEGMEPRLLLASGSDYIGGIFNPGNWGIVGAVQSGGAAVVVAVQNAGDAVAGAAQDVGAAISGAAQSAQDAVNNAAYTTVVVIAEFPGNLQGTLDAAGTAISNTWQVVSTTASAEAGLLPGTLANLLTTPVILDTFESGQAADSLAGFVEGFGDHYLNNLGVDFGLQPIYGYDAAFSNGHILGDAKGYAEDLALLLSGGLGLAGGTSGAVGGGASVSGGTLTLSGTLDVAGTGGMVVNGGVFIVGGVDLVQGILNMVGNPGDGGPTGDSSSGRPFRDLLDDYRNNPDGWEVIQQESVPSSNIRNPGGSSIQELLQNPETGETIVRHTLLRPDGTIFEPSHFRPMWK